ncbi:glycosyl hydrolase family 65 protein [Opitutus terrae]|uniref:Kojibiose phosphorylase n=1 Tax=Opitutus terrae (strain DSM 11246 / JCM 15787 / PB90-1) TaxID=452637 RepID=B1ZXT6_OPITP|nr:glycosyl hydrolase family 65 protein [Opitutus terrae]ACB74304.1 Kojibiose phosphorylase [Opitutus terrae PB90-1]
MKQLWEISTTECAGSKESIMLRGNVYQIANGAMGYRGTLDEFGPAEAVGITLAGIFDQVGEAWREPVNAPNGGYTRVSLDGTPLSALDDTVVAHRQVLHFRDARFERETVFAVGGKKLTLRSSRFLSVVEPNLGVIRLSVSCDQDADIAIATGIDYNIWDLNGPHLRELTPSQSDDLLCVDARTHEARKRVAVAEAVATELGGSQPLVAENRNLRRFAFRARAGEIYVLDKFFAVFAEQDSPATPPARGALELVKRARQLGRDACLAQHAAEWQSRWARCDVVIAGDDEAQQALRYSLLQLLMVAPVQGSANSIPARALSGQVYKGAVFWDTEMFMLPFFLHTYPEKAVELLRYRIRTLDGARRKAQTEGPGYRGAFYAWESQDTGDDACTYFNIGDPITGRELRTHFRDKQVHISGDVALALWEYFRITGDDRMLREGGAEVILECARFYYSYAHFKKDRGRYEILDVIGPDEYHERVNNNAFTNAVVRETFAIAGAVVAHLERTHPAELKTLLAKLDIAGELPAFADAAARLYVPAPHPKTRVIEQFEGYLKLRDASVEELKAKMVHPNEYLGAGQGLAVPTKLIKQADVVMMLNLFRARYPTEVKQANWRYYEPRTEHGSSLSACAYAMVATEIGEGERAYDYFLKTATIDLEAKYKVYVGTTFIGGSHPAANGGAWMTAVFGFGGVLIEENRILIQPRLPRKWRSLEFGLEHRGDRFQIRITADRVSVEPALTNRHEHAFMVAGEPVTCARGNPVTVEHGRSKPALSGSRAI